MQPINGDSSINLMNALAERIAILRNFQNGLPVDVNGIIIQYDQDDSKLEEAVGIIFNENKQYLHGPGQSTFIEPRMQQLLQAIGRLQDRIHSLTLDPAYLSWIVRPNPILGGRVYNLDTHYRFATITKVLPYIKQLSFTCKHTGDVVDDALYYTGGVLAVAMLFRKLEFLDLSKRRIEFAALSEILKLPHLKKLKIVGCVLEPADPRIPVDLYALRASAPHIEIVDQESSP